MPREWVEARIGGEGAVPVYINARSGLRQVAHPNHAFALHKGGVAAAAVMGAAKAELAERTPALDADLHSVRLAAAECHRALYETRRASLNPHRAGGGGGGSSGSGVHLTGSPLSSPRSGSGYGGGGAPSPTAPAASPFAAAVPATVHSDAVRADLTRLLLRVTAIVSSTKTRDVLLRSRVSVA